MPFNSEAPIDFSNMDERLVREVFFLSLSPAPGIAELMWHVRHSQLSRVGVRQYLKPKILEDVAGDLGWPQHQDWARVVAEEGWYDPDTLSFPTPLDLKITIEFSGDLRVFLVGYRHDLRNVLRLPLDCGEVDG